MQQQCVPSFQNSLSGLSGQNIDTFRQRNFSHWVYADLTGYCQSFAGWDFFGFLVREPEILCVAAANNGDFFFSHAQHHLLEQVLAERLEAHPLPTPESVRMALLDLAAGDPWFSLAYPTSIFLRTLCSGTKMARVFSLHNSPALSRRMILK